MILSCHNLSKSFGEKIILKDASFHIEDREKAALIGNNGAGKTTLLRIIMNEMPCDSGNVVISKDKNIGYLAQYQDIHGHHSIYEELLTTKQHILDMESRLRTLEQDMKDASGETLEALMNTYTRLNHQFELENGYAYKSEVTGVLKGLGFGEEDFTKQIETLSGGQKTRVSLGKLLLSKPDVILLDEPTNDLDIPTLTVLEDYLERFPGIVIAVSHDRWFLDRVVRRVIEIQNGKAEFYEGNYSFYVEEKERRYQERLKQYEKEQAKIEQLQEAADKLHLWAFMGADKLHKRAFSMEKRIERLRTTDRPTKERRLDIKFGEREFRGDEVLTIQDLKKSFDGRTLFEHVDLEVVGGERIALLGDNGTGKSTLVKIILGEEEPDSGRLRMGPTVRIGYLPQIIQFSHPERNLVEAVELVEHPWFVGVQFHPERSGAAGAKLLKNFLEM